MNLETQTHVIVCTSSDPVCRKGSIYISSDWVRTAKKAVEHYITTGHTCRILSEVVTIVADKNPPPEMAGSIPSLPKTPRFNPDFLELDM